jgi:hypothetical protein
VSKKTKPWHTGRAGKGYKIGSSGTSGVDPYLSVTIPLGVGFKRGDRVFMKEIEYDGSKGLFLTKWEPSAEERYGV